MCVHFTLMRQSTGRSRAADRSPLQRPQYHGVSRLPNDDVPLREEVVPIHDIRITFGPGYRLGTVHLEPEGQELKVDTHARRDECGRSAARHSLDGRG